MKVHKHYGIFVFVFCVLEATYGISFIDVHFDVCINISIRRLCVFCLMGGDSGNVCCSNDTGRFEEDKGHSQLWTPRGRQETDDRDDDGDKEDSST